MRVDIVTIFPDYLSPLQLSLVGKARAAGRLDVRVHDLRRWTDGPHRSVDDTPYGGGPGMVMKPEPWGAVIDELVETAGAPPLLVLPTPSGRLFSQQLAAELAAQPWLVFACGRYEGIDARVAQEAADRAPVLELSIGDYVLGGGEAAALVIMEAVARLVPGVLGNSESLVEESHAAGLLEGPAYTKPATWRGRSVPDVLLSGDHARIARWRRDEAIRRTDANRPDLVARLDPATLDARDLAVLAEAGWHSQAGGFRRDSAAVADWTPVAARPPRS